MSYSAEFGPLQFLIGHWEGDKGSDMAPEKSGLEENPYFETLVFEPVGTVTNAEEQNLTVIRYLQSVFRKSNNEMFHNETGYYMWDADAKIVMQSLTIPRGVCLLAGGSVTMAGDSMTLKVSAEAGGKFSVIESPFMAGKARTKSFTHEISVNADTLSYTENTVVEIYGRTFDHTDRNELRRVN